MFELSLQHEREKRRIQEDGVSVDTQGLHILVFESAGKLSEIAEDLSQDFNLCIGLNRATGEVILRTRNKNLGLGNITQQFFRGGGHPTSAGFRYSELSSLTVAQLI